MNPNNPIPCLALAAVTLTLTSTLAAAAAVGRSTASLPRLEKRGAATQLIVDGRPYLILGGETANQSGSGLRFSGPHPTVQHVQLYRYR